VQSHQLQTAVSALDSSFSWQTAPVCHLIHGTLQVAGDVLVLAISCSMNYFQYEHCTCLGIGNTARSLGGCISH
jgi:hypothetical protein